MVGKCLFKNEKMKILMVFIRWPGGVGEVIRNISSELKKLGHEVDVISREEDLKKYSLISSFFPIRETVKKLTKEKRYDIIYTHDWSCAFPLLFPYPLLKKRHFCIFYGNQLKFSRIFQVIVGKIMGKHLIVVGDLNKKKFPNATLIRNAVNMKKFRPLGKKRIYLGWPEKVTESISREKVMDIGEKIKIPILIAKDIPHEKMNDFYNKCEIFLSLPPRNSAGALSWMEAMAAGVPKIIGNNESESYLFPIDKIKKQENIVDTILKAKKRDYRKWLTKSDFGWDTHTKKLLKLFREH
jgi:glycosyltransferase involved in cell wall biosynthesis